MRIPLDVVGDIAIFKFAFWHPLFFKKFYAWRFLANNKHVKVALEKTAGFSGELRIQKTNWIAGDKRKDTLHRENGCSFYLNVDETYFSPRLSQERKIVAEEICKAIIKKRIKNPQVLVMFGGIAPQAVVLASLLKKSKLKAEIISSELNGKACEFAEKNITLNKLTEYISAECGDSRKLCLSLAKKKRKFDFVLMLRPNLKDTFLKEALKVSKRGTNFYYHGFGEEEKVRKEVLLEIQKANAKVRGFSIRKAGDIGVKTYRWNVSFSV